MRIPAFDLTSKRIGKGVSLLRRGSGVIAFMVTTLLVAAGVAWGLSSHAPSNSLAVSSTQATTGQAATLPSSTVSSPPSTIPNSAAGVCQVAAPQNNKGNPSPFIAWLYTQCKSYVPGDPSPIASALQAAKGGQIDALGWLMCHYANQQVSSGHATWLDKMTATNCEVKPPSPVTGIQKMVEGVPGPIDENTIYTGSPVGDTDSVVVWAGTYEPLGAPPVTSTGAVVEAIGPAEGAVATVPGSGALTLTAVLSSTSLQLKGQNGKTYTFDIATGKITAG